MQPTTSNTIAHTGNGGCKDLVSDKCETHDVQTEHGIDLSVDGGRAHLPRLREACSLACLFLEPAVSQPCQGGAPELVHRVQRRRNEEAEVVPRGRGHAPAYHGRCAQCEEAGPDQEREEVPNQSEHNEGHEEEHRPQESREVERRLHELLCAELLQVVGRLRPPDAIGASDDDPQQAHDRRRDGVDEQPEGQGQQRGERQERHREAPHGAAELLEAGPGPPLPAPEAHRLGVLVCAWRCKLPAARVHVVIAVVPVDSVLPMGPTFHQGFATGPAPLAPADLASHVVATPTLHRLTGATWAVARAE
mmetsp:Transcript_88456/g.286449  ORF Transcript_88456/g.286449 Transcript_88456/m.286449 type:complete len:306 (-) Transcript_88456:1096-2013(-)